MCNSWFGVGKSDGELTRTFDYTSKKKFESVVKLDAPEPIQLEESVKPVIENQTESRPDDIEGTKFVFCKIFPSDYSILRPSV